MNFFEHHIGDYAVATSHLSFVEDAAYTRLIRKYYSSEKPLPKDFSDAQRLVGAKTKQEKIAVTAMLQEFFILQEDGWHNARCDEEIAKYQSTEPERELKKANEDARLRRHREERMRLFEALRKAGQHPEWNISMGALKAMHERHCNAPATPPATPPATATETFLERPCNAPATASHIPLPTTHYPLPSNSEVGGASAKPTPAKPKPKKTSIPTDFVLTPELEAYAVKHLPAVDPPELVESFRRKAESKGWTYANWRQAFQDFIRNASPGSGHFASGQYPRKSANGKIWE